MYSINISRLCIVFGLQCGQVESIYGWYVSRTEFTRSKTRRLISHLWVRQPASKEMSISGAISLIKYNCPQTLARAANTAMACLKSLYNVIGRPWGCLLPIPTHRSSLPDWTPLISCQLDWLQVFIICDDWVDLEANGNQSCWRTGEICSSTGLDNRQEVLPSNYFMYWFNLHAKGPLFKLQQKVRSLSACSPPVHCEYKAATSFKHNYWALILTILNVLFAVCLCLFLKSNTG